MALYLTNRPSTYITFSIASFRLSRWNALHNPIRLEFQRKDVIGSGFTLSNGGPGHMRLNLQPLVAAWGSYSVGDVIYIGGANAYNTTATITQIHLNAPTYTGAYIVVDIPYAGNYGNRFFNFISFMKSYYVEIELYDSEKHLTYGTWRGTPNSKWELTADVSGFLKSHLEIKDESDFFSKNKKVKKSFGRIDFKYREVINDIGYFQEGSDYFYWTNSAKQIQEKYSGNMAEYVPFDEPAINEEKKMKFLMEGRPTLFVGYPFDLYWIYPEGFDDHVVERHQQNKDLNGNATTAESNTTLYSSDRRGVNTLLPAQIDANAATIDVWLEQGAEREDDGYTIPTFVTPGFTGGIIISRPISTGGAASL